MKIEQLNKPIYIPKEIIKEQYKELLKEVSNIDGTARIQSINKEDNPSMFNLLTDLTNKQNFHLLF